MNRSSKQLSFYQSQLRGLENQSKTVAALTRLPGNGACFFFLVFSLCCHSYPSRRTGIQGKRVVELVTQLKGQFEHNVDALRRVVDAAKQVLTVDE